MASKAKKISINAFEKATKENYQTTTTVDWNGLEVIIRRNIGLDEMLVFVENAAKACFSEQDGKYMPELKDFAIRAITIELYTNIATPADVSKKYDLLYASDIWQTVLEHIDMDQFNGIVIAIDDKVDNTADANVSLINKQFTDLYGSVENIQSQLSSLFDGIGADDIKNIAGALGNGAIDEEKLMQAYLESRNKNDKD